MAFIELPFAFAPESRARMRLWEHGELVRDRHAVVPALRGPAQYIRDVVQAFAWAADTRFDMCIAVDPLNTVTALLLRRLGRVRSVVSYIIDYVPRRFKNRLLNWMYRFADRLAYQHADLQWVLTTRMRDVRARNLGVRRTSRHVIVPIGASLHGGTSTGAESARVAFVGHMLEKQGLQVVLQALPHIAKRVPTVTLVAVGSGPYLPQLQHLSVELGCDHLVEWHGIVPDHERMAAILGGCAMGVAPYKPALDTWTYYADPGKVKDYLACGLPVIITDVPAVARLIEQEQCGAVVPYDVAAFTSAIAELLEHPARLAQMQENALRVARRYEWTTVYAEAMIATADALKWN